MEKLLKITLLRAIRCRFLDKSGGHISMGLLIMALGWAPAVRAQSFQDLINEAHSQRDRYSGSRPPAPEQERHRETRAEKEAAAWAGKMVKQDQAEAERIARQKAH